MSNTIRKTANTVLDKLAESAQQTAAIDERNAKYQKQSWYFEQNFNPRVKEIICDIVNNAKEK